MANLKQNFQTLYNTLKSRATECEKISCGKERAEAYRMAADLLNATCAASNIFLQTKTDLQLLGQAIYDCTVNDPLHFDDDAVEVQGARLWAVCVSPAGDVHAMDNNEEWAKVEEKDVAVVEALLIKVTGIRAIYSQPAKYVSRVQEAHHYNEAEGNLV